MNRPKSPPAIKIAREEAERLEISAWDRIAPLRARDLDAGNDPSFEEVIFPTFRALLRSNRTDGLLDIGCGVGRLTKRIAQVVDATIVGIDPSPVSAQFAQNHLRDDVRITVHNMKIQEYAHLGYRHDAALASMVMQDLVDLRSFLAACRTALTRGGHLYAAITHPYFWPIYWHYDTQPWYRYDRELLIKSEFRTSHSNSGVETLHVHRPLQAYFDAMKEVGFEVVRLLEPMMSPSQQRNNGVRWTSPHFLFIAARRR